MHYWDATGIPALCYLQFVWQTLCIKTQDDLHALKGSNVSFTSVGCGLIVIWVPPIIIKLTGQILSWILPPTGALILGQQYHWKQIHSSSIQVEKMSYHVQKYSVSRKVALLRHWSLICYDNPQITNRRDNLICLSCCSCLELFVCSSFGSAAALAYRHTADNNAILSILWQVFYRFGEKNGEKCFLGFQSFFDFIWLKLKM